MNFTFPSVPSPQPQVTATCSITPASTDPPPQSSVDYYTVHQVASPVKWSWLLWMHVTSHNWVATNYLLEELSGFKQQLWVERNCRYIGLRPCIRTRMSQGFDPKRWPLLPSPQMLPDPLRSSSRLLVAPDSHICSLLSLKCCGIGRKLPVWVSWQQHHQLSALCTSHIPSTPTSWCFCFWSRFNTCGVYFGLLHWRGKNGHVQYVNSFLTLLILLAMFSTLPCRIPFPSLPFLSQLPIS